MNNKESNKVRQKVRRKAGSVMPASRTPAADSAGKPFAPPSKSAPRKNLLRDGQARWRRHNRFVWDKGSHGGGRR